MGSDIEVNSCQKSYVDSGGKSMILRCPPKTGQVIIFILKGTWGNRKEEKVHISVQGKSGI